MTTEAEERSPGPDDTAAFQRFYQGGQADRRREGGLLYRLFVGWWHDKT